ncbi:inorganic pyrophosphatase [Candidatus Woesebacteria bacterium RBG_16_39_8b]|uniref:Inorganic pyrophosphatase n=1 Tax=Candidatus Woesebacteria bacterium RBG_16_39_8b TaxID=1802482 RepID=A0A1F7X8G0_9BACT|nr:MAG: inorganic pyrophosphatase [Candidatus Woesebacteria bacterium RBG_16_39_8b]
MEFNVLIEVGAGGNVKYELDEKTQELKVDRFLHSSLVYPFNYGSIENTQGEDGDPLDALVLSEMPVEPGVTIKCRPIGLLEMEDEAGIDTKIIAVPEISIDPVFGKYDEINDVPKATLDEIAHFFKNYKSLEPGKWVKIGGYHHKSLAEKAIREAQEKNNSSE